MVLPEEPWQRKDTALQYYAYRHDTLFLILNLILCPFTCGCIYCLTMPLDRITVRTHGLPVDERMADMHFARQGRKLNRRTSLSLDRPGGKTRKMLNHQKKTSSQSLSPIFTKLPYEIRSHIFELVLFDTGAVIIRTVPITSERLSLQQLHVRACRLVFDPPPSRGDWYRVAQSSIYPVHISTALLRVCRLVYKEALPILYAQTQFVFTNPRHLVAFSHSVPLTHFEQIRSILLEYSEISQTYQSYHRTFRTPFLEPMKNFLGVIRVMRRIRSIFVVFRITQSARVLRSELNRLLEDMQEYQERIAGVTFEQCRIHLVVSYSGRLHFQRTIPGLLESESAHS